MSVRALVVAKAPVPGLVKTRLGVDIGMEAAAAVAAASLLDTLAACTAAYGADSCHVALDGALDDAVSGGEIAEALAGWTVRPQRGDGLAERLVHAHADLAAAGPGAVVQVGMDTPQVTGDLLHEVAGLLAGGAGHDAVLGPAVDGGWWVLGLRDGLHAAPLRDVAMSTPTTYADTCRALEGAGLRVGRASVLRDVDTVDDAALVAGCSPGSRFARSWAAVAPRA